jgi:hypothetical protein
MPVSELGIETPLGDGGGRAQRKIWATNQICSVGVCLTVARFSEFAGFEL